MLNSSVLFFTYGKASRLIEAKFISSSFSLLVDKFPIGGHRARITGQFNVIDHS